MRRKKFFENLGNQLIFGLFVTIAAFIMYAAMSTLVLNTFDLTMTRYVVAEGDVKDLVPDAQCIHQKIDLSMYCQEYLVDEVVVQIYRQNLLSLGFELSQISLSAVHVYVSVRIGLLAVLRN
jgi:hypothetical protein